MIRLSVWCVALLFCNTIWAQDLATTLVARRANMFESSKDSLDELLLQQVEAHLAETCIANTKESSVFYSPDSLAYEDGKGKAYTFMNELVALRSQDDSVQIVSWDDLGGGSYHSYTGLIKFRTKEDGCEVMSLDQVTGETETSIYAIYDLPTKGNTRYLLLGYGT